MHLKSFRVSLFALVWRMHRSPTTATRSIGLSEDT